MWFIGVEVEQETSAPPPKKILDPPLLCGNAVIKPLVIYFTNISDKFAFALYYTTAQKLPPSVPARCLFKAEFGVS